MHKLILSLLFLVIVNPIISQNSEIPKKSETPKHISAWSPIWRSTLVPGWGHIYLGNQRESKYQKILGYTYLGSFLGSMVLHKMKYDEYIEAGEKYNRIARLSNILTSTSTGFEGNIISIIAIQEPRRDYFNLAVEVNNIAFTLIAIYSIQWIHSIVSGVSASNETLKNQSSFSKINVNAFPERNILTNSLGQYYEMNYLERF